MFKQIPAKAKRERKKIAAPMNIHGENEKKTLHFGIEWKLVAMSGFSEFCKIAHTQCVHAHAKYAVLMIIRLCSAI